MASANLKRGSNAVIYTVLAIGIVVFVNVISSRFFGRVDLTEDQIFALEDNPDAVVGQQRVAQSEHERLQHQIPRERRSTTSPSAPSIVTSSDICPGRL